MTGMLGALFSIPWWAALAIIVVVLLAVMELGWQIGRSAAATLKHSSSGISTLVGALITVLALLLGFSFSMAESRLASRKAILIDEANAIGTAYLRAKLLPEPHSSRVQADLRDYVLLRIPPASPESLETAIRESEVIHQRLWIEVAAVASAAPESEVIGRFITAVNELIDLHATRVTVGLYQRIPKAIMSVIALVTLLSMLLLGYWFGLKRERAILASLSIVVSLSFAIVMINEIDTPGTAMLEATQKIMTDLQQSLFKDTAPHSTAQTMEPAG